MTHLNYLRRAIDPSLCIYEAWDLIKKRIFFYICASLVVVVIPQLPYVNYAGFLLAAPLMGGLAYIVLRDTSDEPVDFGMIFKGFQKLLPLLSVALIQVVPAFAFAGAVLFMTSTGVFSSMADSGIGSGRGGAVGFGFPLGMIVIWVVGYVVFTIIWSWALTFAIPLIIEHDVSVIDAIKLSLGATFNNVGGLFFLGLASTLVALLGLLALVVGLLVAIPVIQVAGIMAYRQVFPRVTVPPDMPPPSGDSIYD